MKLTKVSLLEASLLFLSQLQDHNIPLHPLKLPKDITDLNSIPSKKLAPSHLQPSDRPIPQISMDRYPPHHPDQIPRAWVVSPKLLKSGDLGKNGPSIEMRIGNDLMLSSIDAAESGILGSAGANRL